MSRILIIEDDEDLREGLAFSLALDGCETSCAGTKREGMEQLKKGRYDLVLLDCNLPDGSGYDLCTEIREYGDMPIFNVQAVLACGPEGKDPEDPSERTAGQQARFRRDPH